MNKKAEYNIKYQREHMRRIPLDVRNEYYYEVLKPAVERSGESMNGFIKKAIQEKLERDGLV